MIVTGQSSVTTMRSDFNTDTGSASGGPTSILIRNTGTTTVYIGGAGVTSSNGFALDAGAGLGLDNINVNDLYAVCGGSDTGTICWLYERNG